MLDPNLAESLEEGNVFFEYSMERFEHRIPAQPRRSSNQFIEEDEQPTLPRMESHRGSTLRITSTGSSCSSSTSAPPSSRESSSGSEDNGHDDAIPAAGLSGHPPHINNHLVDRLNSLQDNNAALQDQVRQLQASQFDNIVLATSAPADTGVDSVRATVSDAMQPSFVPSSMRSLSDVDVKLFDPLSIALFSEEELHHEGANFPEVHSLQQEITELSEDKRLLLAENHHLEREKHVLEASLAKARREIEEAAISIVERISPSKGNLRVHALDSDVQRLCNLSRLLGDENGRLRSQIRDKEAEIRIMKEEMGDMKTQNSRLVIEMSSARAQREVLEEEIERIKEAAAKAGREAEEARARLLEEVEGARRTMQGMREEEKRLISENVRVEREMGAVLESLEEFEERQVALRGEKQRAAIEASQWEAELSDALARVANEVDACRKAVERAERAETSALELRQEVADLRFQMQQLAQELESEKAGREVALQEMALLSLRERALTQDMRQLVRTGDMAGPQQHHLMALPAGVSISPCGGTTAVAALESQLSSWLNERADLQEVDKELHEQVEKLVRGLSESLQDMEDQLLHWKGINAHVELAIRQARNRSSLSEHHAKTLLSHLFPDSSSLSKRALHAVAASGALASIGLLAYAKLKKLSSS
ncbi:hypothetical protein GOP47_0011363 [Adiantum capillus-veneris]|uniref:Uncharacterized protein n=1 Tax=Adiantum capillus-veneris TaxID=13818 RepID=A0A9D4USM9_ADICA|nr:hypothetical protein GOP47_0011363 [Adiantum capillus-veneris]